MQALKELLSTDVGLLSLAVIVGVIAIGAYLSRWVGQRMREDEAAARRGTP